MFRGTKIAKIYHDITAKYNGYFNAREIKRDMVEANRNQYQDDYTKVLPINRFPDDQMAKSNSSKSDKIIEKVTRVIQKHKPSKWTDDCYLLMGKAYFYKGEYISAIERFRYVNSKFEGKIPAYEALIWITYSYLQQGDVSQARALMTDIKTEENFPESLQKELKLAEAEVAIAREKYETAYEKLKAAIPEVSDRDQETRYLFILGQLAQERGNYAKGIVQYNKVLSKRPPYETDFHAKINKASCFQQKGSRNLEKIQADLKEMLKDEKNVDYKSRIYYELAQLAKRNNNQQQFIQYLKKALSAKKATKKQKANAYQNLAQYYFKNGQYGKSKAYFDSTFDIITKDHENYEVLSSKKDVLDELIKYKRSFRTQDSLQKMAKWNKNQFKNQFQQVLKREKEKKKSQAQQARRKKRMERLKRSQQQQLQRGQEISQAGNQRRNNNQWYFYNQRAKEQGQPAFQRKWGKRPLQDNWRIKTEKASDFEESKEEGTDKPAKTQAEDQQAKKNPFEAFANQQEVIPDNFEKLPQTEKVFYSQIPFDSAKMAASDAELQKALYNTGVIYYKDLKDLDRAARHLHKLQEEHPGNPYEPKAYYYLYKIYQDKDNLEKANKFKQKLLNQYPNNQYATLIKNPEKLRASANKNNPELESYYDKTHQYYKNGQCRKVRSRMESADSSFEDNYLQTKFEYLTILCEGKHEDTRKTFKKKLKKFIEENKEKQPVIGHAQNVYNYLVTHDGSKQKTRQQKQDFPFDENASERHLYFIAVPIDNNDTEKIKLAYSQYNNEYYKFLNLSISTLMYQRDKRIIVVRDFENKGQGLDYLKSVKNDEAFKKQLGLESINHFVASVNNYKKVIKNKQLPLYEQFFNQEYLKVER